MMRTAWRNLAGSVCKARRSINYPTVEELHEDELDVAVDWLDSVVRLLDALEPVVQLVVPDCVELLAVLDDDVRLPLVVVADCVLLDLLLSLELDLELSDELDSELGDWLLVVADCVLLEAELAELVVADCVELDGVEADELVELLVDRLLVDRLLSELDDIDVVDALLTELDDSELDDSSSTHKILASREPDTGVMSVWKLKTNGFNGSPPA